jgi:hypothetical protein
MRKEYHDKEISDLIAIHKKEIFEWRSKVRHLKLECQRFCHKISDLQVSDHSTDSESDIRGNNKMIESGPEQQK